MPWHEGELKCGVQLRDESDSHGRNHVTAEVGFAIELFFLALQQFLTHFFIVRI